MSTPGEQAKRAVEEVLEELRRESRATGTEIRSELQGARRETRAALREAMAEVRQAFREVLNESSPPEEALPVSTRLTRAERKELTRELLLDAAIEVFAQRGYHGASLEDVAAAAGFTKGAVYSNFSTKADLFMALLVRETGRRNVALARVFAQDPLHDLPEQAGRWLERQAGEERDWDILTVEFWLASARDPVVAERLRESRRELVERLGRVLDTRLEQAAAHPGFDGQELVVLLDALGSGLLMDSVLEPERVRPELFARAVRKLLVDAALDDGEPGAAEDRAGPTVSPRYSVTAEGASSG